MGNVSNIIWVLPRPRSDHYPGGFPLHFEHKMLKLLQLNGNARVLHPFGGMAEYGTRLDTSHEVNPDVIGTAHKLPFKDEAFNLVMCDPPYTAALARSIYNSKAPKFKLWGSEAVRVCKEMGFICLYHWLMMPRLPGTALRLRIVILQRTWGRPRVATVLQKNTPYHI